MLIPGHGIGPEITEATQRALDALGTHFNFIVFNDPLDAQGNLRSDLLAAIRKTGVALKGPLDTPDGGLFRSINIRLREALDLYAGVRPARSFSGVPSRYRDIDLVVIRENLFGLYCGVELLPTRARELIRDPKLPPGAAVSCNALAPKGCERIAEYAFRYAEKHGSSKVTIVHKANINKATDGAFLAIAREVAAKHLNVEYEDFHVDNAATRLVENPCRFDVLLCTNHHGDILSGLTAGLVGGLGLAPSGQYGAKIAVFEAVHGTAPDIVGKEIANPAALMLSAALMLEHLEMFEQARQLERAIAATLKRGRKWRTRDIAGCATTTKFTNAVIENIKSS